MNNWPKPDYDSLCNAFGRFELDSEGNPTSRWENGFLCTVDLPYPMRLSWDKDVIVRKITCNQAVRGSLMNCLDSILKLYGSLKEVQSNRMDLYGGCYCFRRMRGGFQPSIHSWGAAIDLDPEYNSLGKCWNKRDNMMPMEVVKIFEDAGWSWGGRWKSRADCMHFEATTR